MDTQIEAFAWELRRRQVKGSRETALETVLLLRQYIAKAKFSSMDQLVQKVKEIGRKLVQSQPMEHSVGNTVRKVLHHMREEYHTAAKTLRILQTPSPLSSSEVAKQSGQISATSQLVSVVGEQQSSSVSRFMSRSTSLDDDVADGTGFAEALKPVFLEAVQDVIDELETVYESIGKNAIHHIHYDEIILTIGFSKTVQAFLKAAHKSRKFTVIVTETALSFGGSRMAQSLSKIGISTVLVPDSSIYGLMSRVNKVIIGAHTIFTDGGMFSIAGSLLAATAARAHSTPVVVVTGQFKITPFPNQSQQDAARDFANPAYVLGFNEGRLLDKVDVINPTWDYVKPGLIDVFVTNDGDHPPSSIHRLIKDAYDDEDHEL